MSERRCPECGSARVYFYAPYDGGPEPPKWECDDCGEWTPVGPDE